MVWGRGRVREREGTGARAETDTPPPQARRVPPLPSSLSLLTSASGSGRTTSTAASTAGSALGLRRTTTRTVAGGGGMVCACEKERRVGGRGERVRACAALLLSLPHLLNPSRPFFAHSTRTSHTTPWPPRARKRCARLAPPARADADSQPGGARALAHTFAVATRRLPASHTHPSVRASGRAAPGPAHNYTPALPGWRGRRLSLAWGAVAWPRTRPARLFAGRAGAEACGCFGRRPGPRPMLLLARRSSSLPLPLPPTPPQVPAAVAGAQSESGGSVIAAGGWYAQLRPGLAGGELTPPIELFASPPRPRRPTARRSKKNKMRRSPPPLNSRRPTAHHPAPHATVPKQVPKKVRRAPGGTAGGWRRPPGWLGPPG